ncbi:Lrp/AsnC family transcriptional regulator [Streptomyces sp. 62]|uniref:Lrp/AsnC family transcriptional regulator n=1 Tax=Streptomyces sp. NPDC012756 TaxID=3364847 RepID=UPI000E28A0C7
MIGEEDLALVHALQVRPRASWVELGEVLGCTPATVARRWERLAGTGAAWVTAVPGPRCAALTAYVGLRCVTGTREKVAQALAGDPAAVTVEITAGSYDLLVEVITADLASFGRYLLDRIERLPGVTGSTVAIATTVVTEASRWRLDALAPDQSAALGDAPRGGSVPARRLTELDRRLLAGLGRDGRQAWHQLAQETDTSAATARRRAERLLASGEAALRCDVAGPLFERPVTVSLWAQVPAPELRAVARHLAAVPSVRFVATTAGRENLLVALWLRSPEEIQQLEVELALRHPAVLVQDRTIALRTAKRMGRLFDANGYGTASVPLAPWAEQTWY